MANDTFLANLEQVASVPLDYPIPGSLELALQSVTATFDGTSAASSYLPALQVIGPGNIAPFTFVNPNGAVSAGDSAEVTFGTFLGGIAGGGGSFPGGIDSTTTAGDTFGVHSAGAPAGYVLTAIGGGESVWAPGNDPLLGLLIKYGVGAYWPFTEASGTVAHDGSGNGNDLTVVNARTSVGGDGPSHPDKWSWADTVFGAGNSPYCYGRGNPDNPYASIGAAIPNFNGSVAFAVGVFININDVIGGMTVAVTQGSGVIGGGGNGWAMWRDSGFLEVEFTGISGMTAGATFPNGEWILAGVQCDGSGNWSLWQDAVQVATTTGTITGSTGLTFGQSGGFAYTGWYGPAFWTTRDLTASEWSSILNAI